jgi:hypothetical protein
MITVGATFRRIAYVEHVEIQDKAKPQQWQLIKNSRDILKIKLTLGRIEHRSIARDTINRTLASVTSNCQLEATSHYYDQFKLLNHTTSIQTLQVSNLLIRKILEDNPAGTTTLLIHYYFKSQRL